MKIFYITTEDSALQGDYLEVMSLIGLRTVFGDNVIDVPRKKVMYGDFYDTPRHSLHGRGFSLFSRPIPDLSDPKLRELEPGPEDILIYGVVPPTYGVQRRPDWEDKAALTVVLDGHDDTNLRLEFIFEPDGSFKKNFLYFKRELIQQPLGNVKPINFSIPSWCIRPVDFSKKIQLYPRTVPKGCFQDGYHEQGRGHYVFSDENLYYEDLAASWFGLTKKKGGWDQLRHLEIVAAGTPVLYQDDYFIPKWIIRGFPHRGFGDWGGAKNVMKLMMDGDKPDKFYLELLNKQRSWLYKHGICEAVACYVYDEIVKYMEERK